jgi:hypothetical protein
LPGKAFETIESGLPMVDSTLSATVPFVSLQRSEMFIDNAMNSISGASAERNVSGNGRQIDFRFRSAGARRNLLEVARSINISPLMGEGNNDLLHFKVESTNHTPPSR